MTHTPEKFILAIDVDLTNGSDGELKQLGLVRFVITEAMNRENFLRLIHNSRPDFLFEEWIVNYACDICASITSEENPIYTNNGYCGGDICTKCFKKSFPDLHPIPGEDQNVYRLSEIVKCVKDNKR